ncbi:E3 ubiquitin-protein ligase rnf8-A-like [Xenopus laevis]|uniref:E3 ubiquitin-protein ligase rnf8-A-like n=2 Tax=Xenopus laevis TaxID=8355 RepID=A0A1L8F0P4_XENLA|nr:E3 ubiquitin-protein ligase rnf8-A-like [Xenopus laevis]XP_041431260.1 E3 ubiquitin-protein ligase rnf8-A-like [Xenopus laevis]OCT65176.1 hypothetical protein XELAEV_18041415mg [Xenopus laevis]
MEQDSRIGDAQGPTAAPENFHAPRETMDNASEQHVCSLNSTHLCEQEEGAVSGGQQVLVARGDPLNSWPPTDSNIEHAQEQLKDTEPPKSLNEDLDEHKALVEVSNPTDLQDGASLASPRDFADQETKEDQRATEKMEGQLTSLCGSQQGLDVTEAKGQDAEPTECSILLEENLEQECPICTEPYNGTSHKQSFLNCNHTFCNNCIKTIIENASRAEIGRVVCPICRQRTPTMQWEILKMQEQMMDNVTPQIQQFQVAQEPPTRGPGLCWALEYRFQKRFYTTRMFPFAPCCRYPVRCISGLRKLERRNRCLYRCLLGLLFLMEIMSFFVIFLPIIILILVIVFTR